MKSLDVLKNRDFRTLWMGQAISQLGDALYGLLFGFMVGKITGRQELVGYALAFQALPFVLLSGYAGVLADRLDRRTILVLSDYLAGVVLAILLVYLLLVGSPPVWALFLIPFLLSCIQVFFLPAKSACIPRLVPSEQLARANSLSIMTQTLMPIIGLAFSALVLGMIEKGTPQWLFPIGVTANMISFFVSGAICQQLPPIKVEHQSDEPKHPLQDLRDGFSYMRSLPMLMATLWATFLLNISIGPFMVAYYASNKAWFGESFSTLATIELSFMVMMLLGAARAGGIHPRRLGWNFSIMIGAAGILVALMGFAPVLWQFMLLNALCGPFIPLGNLPLQVKIQQDVDDAFMGRVQSFFAFASQSATPFGILIGSLILAKCGLTPLYLYMGLGTTIAAMVPLLWREFRELNPGKTALVD